MMATTPPLPPAHSPSPWERSQAPERGAAPGPALPGAPRTPRKAETIPYTPVMVEGSRWGRRMLIGVVVVAVLFGAIGWYRHLTRPPVSVRPVSPTSGRAPSTPSPAPVPSPATTTSHRRGSEAREPLALTAKELADALRSEPELDRKSVV